MDLEFLVTDAAYVSALSEPAVYVTATGERKDIVMVPDQVPDIMLADADIGVRGVEYAWRVRRSQINQPCKGDVVIYKETHHCIDDFDRLNIAEWVLYVFA